MNIVFMGTAELACPALKALCLLPGHRIVGVFTQPDRPAGRNQKLTASPVKKMAESWRLDIFQPETLRDGAALQTLRRLKPDLIVVVAFGQILQRDILTLPPLGCVNVHASLLPRWRGAAPIQWAILGGDAETGVTTMLMDEGLDTGAILMQERTPIYSDDTAATLHDRLAEMGGRLIVETVTKLERAELRPQPQDNARATYAKKLTKEDGHIVWRESAETICRKVRAFDPWPTAFCFWDKKLLKIWKAAALKSEGNSHCEWGQIVRADSDGIVVRAGEGMVRIAELQLEGRRRMSAGEFLRGHKLEAEMRLM
jgi:methionyl-tRNA formyltransferase